MSRIVEVVEALISAPEVSEETLRHAVYSQGMDAMIRALFDEGMRLQFHDVERTIRCIDLISRIQAWNRPLKPPLR